MGWFGGRKNNRKKEEPKEITDYDLTDKQRELQRRMAEKNDRTWSESTSGQGGGRTRDENRFGGTSRR